MYGCFFIKKSSSPEKTAQNGGVFRSVPLSHPFSKVGIFFPQPQIGVRKNPETVVVSGFSGDVSKLVANHGISDRFRYGLKSL